MDERFEKPQQPRYYTVNIPAEVRMGQVVSKPLLVSERMIPVLWDIVVRNSREAGRHIAERPYVVEDGGSRSDAMTRIMTHELMDAVAAFAQQHKLSVISVSPVRWQAYEGPVGRAYIEYTTVPLTPWED